MGGEAEGTPQENDPGGESGRMKGKKIKSLSWTKISDETTSWRAASGQALVWRTTKCDYPERVRSAIDD
jgi:hypothetical protein